MCFFEEMFPSDTFCRCFATMSIVGIGASFFANMLQQYHRELLTYMHPGTCLFCLRQLILKPIYLVFKGTNSSAMVFRKARRQKYGIFALQRHLTTFRTSHYGSLYGMCSVIPGTRWTTLYEVYQACSSTFIYRV